MAARVRESSQLKLFYLGLVIAAEVTIVLLAAALWQGMLSLGDGTALLRSAAALLPAIARTPLAAEAHAMGLPLVEGAKAYWYFARAGGMLAYLLLWFGTLWGIFMSSKMMRGWVDAGLAYDLHEFLPILAVVFAGLHGLVLLGDRYIGFTLAQLVIPFTASYRPLWTGFGTLAFYLSAALIASFYLRRFVSRRVWRSFHYMTYAAFTLALTHGMLAGSDSRPLAVQAIYLVTGATVVFATIYRVMTAWGESKDAAVSAQRAGQPAAAHALLPQATSRLALAPIEERAMRPWTAQSDDESML